MAPKAETAAFREAVLRVVAAIPEGRLATYGQVAALAGWPRRPRQVGQVLKGLPEGTDLPWHRVVNAQGRVSPRGFGPEVEIQVARLRSEGVEVLDSGVLDLERLQWRENTDCHGDKPTVAQLCHTKGGTSSLLTLSTEIP